MGKKTKQAYNHEPRLRNNTNPGDNESSTMTHAGSWTKIGDKWGTGEGAKCKQIFNLTTLNVCK